MLMDNLWDYIKVESSELLEWAKCGEGCTSMLPTALWCAGAAALAQRMLSALFRRFVFRRVPMWELMLQYLLFSWIVTYSLHFWVAAVKFIKWSVVHYYGDDRALSPMDLESRVVIQQWVIWVCGAAPLAFYVYTIPRPEPPALMLWITTSPWQRREMGPYGYYLNRPLPPLHLSANASTRHQAIALRKAFSETRVMNREPVKKKRCSKSV